MENDKVESKLVYLSGGGNRAYIDPTKVSFVSVKGRNHSFHLTIVVDGIMITIEGYGTFGSARQDRDRLLERINAST